MCGACYTPAERRNDEGTSQDSITNIVDHVNTHFSVHVKTTRPGRDFVTLCVAQEVI